MRVQDNSGHRPGDGGVRPVANWSEVERIEARARQARAQWLHQALSAMVAGLARHLRDHWIEPARRARQRRRDLKLLLGLDDHTLADIGLRRSDLDAVNLGRIPFEQVVAQKGANYMERVGTVVPMPSKPQPAVAGKDVKAAA